MSCHAVFVMLFVSMFAASPVRAGDVQIEFRAGGRCTITIHDEVARSDRVVDVPGPAAPPSEYRCAILAVPSGRPIRLSVMLPPGDSPSGTEFPRLIWTEHDGHWIGSASLPAAPAFVRVAKSGSAAAGRARVLDWAALAATITAIAWTIRFGVRN